MLFQQKALDRLEGVADLLRIKCPWCGYREESEFTYGGEAHIIRPSDPSVLDDQEWADYLFYRKNPRGLHREQWCHSSGCRRWFNVKRDTLNYEIHDVYKVNDQITTEE